MKKLIKIIATCGGLGYIPFAQGTLASLLGLGVYGLFHNNSFLYLTITCAIVIIGFLVSGPAERFFGIKDSKIIVIDDLSGILIAFTFLHTTVHMIFVGFIIYRIIDISKLYPINKLEKLPSGWGIMLDDIAAGLYTSIILQIITKIHIS